MKQLLVFLLLLCAASVSAQDVIVKKDGSTVVCRVVELTGTEITYKKWSDLNGSNYVMERSAASAINYENGKKINLSEVDNLYKPGNQNDGVQQYNDRALLKMDYQNSEPYKKVKMLNNIGYIGGGAVLATGAALFIGYLTSAEDGHYESGQLIASLACVGTSAIWTASFLLAANHQKKKIDAFEASVIYQYDFKLSNGSSLSAGIDMIKDSTFGKHTLGLGLHYNF